jgi:CHAT domain-containing protein
LGIVLSVVLLWLGAELLLAQTRGPGTPQPALSKEQHDKLKERDRYGQEAEKLHAAGQLTEAIAAIEKMLALEREVFGPVHKEVVGSLQFLAQVHEQREDFAAARKARQEVLDQHLLLLGPQHWEVTNARLALAHVDRLAALTADQRRQLQEANQLNSEVVKLHGQGKTREAVPLAQQALAIRKEVLGEQHPASALSLNNLALLLELQGDYAQAEPLYCQALAIRKQVLGEQHPAYALSLNNLALLYVSQGDYAQAEPLYRQASAIWKQVLGDKHPDYAASLNNLAGLYGSQGDYAQAQSVALQAVHTMRNHLERTAVVQSERQQLAMNEKLRVYLNNYLAIAAGAQAAGEQLYPAVLAWKGSVSARQQFMRGMRRALQAGDKPEVAQRYTELDQAARSLATLIRVTPNPEKLEEHRHTLERLSTEIERLERAVAAASAEFRQQLAQRQRTAADIHQVLPADAVLVDLLEYSHFSPPAERKGRVTWERRLAAFVVRPNQPVVRLDLGPAQPIAAAIAAWRQHFGPSPMAPERDPAVTLRRLVWEPLTPHLQGARTVLLSPDGATAQFPWAALPGKQPGTYLLEELALAVVPIPQQLPELLARPVGGDGEPSLLLVGEVDFDATPGAVDAGAAAAARGGAEPQKWQPLRGTRAEVVAIKDSFQQRYPQATLTERRRERPTESEFRQQAPRHRYLHLATHGFFAAPQLRSALALTSRTDTTRGDDHYSPREVTGFHPGLLSGLVLAGANQPVDPNRDDGILTALEVAALDLGGVELATLSACETGLGASAGGEGLLGLQRAFQTAGARSVVASLWSVRDDAARSLMIDFYDNLWGKKLSRLEALRQAQLTMLREGIKRGLELEAGQPADQRRRLPPYYWAAFVLSGDWR